MTDINPLCKAAWLGDLRGIKASLAQGYDINENSLDKLTPLMYAAKELNEKAVALLLQRGALVNLKVHTHDKFSFLNNQTALSLAVTWPAKQSKAQLNVVEMLIKSGADVNCRDSSRWTPLMGTAGKPLLAKMLIEHGALVNAVNRDGQTAIFYWRSWASLARTIAHIKVLIDNGANLHHRNRKGNTPYDEIGEIGDRACYNKLKKLFAVHKRDEAPNR